MLDYLEVYSVTAKISKLHKISVESKQVNVFFHHVTINQLLFAVNFKICLRIEFDFFTFYVRNRSEEIFPLQP